MGIGPQTPPALLAVTGLSKRFRSTQVLGNVCCSLREGEILGLIGPNGAGKTTFFECLAGLLESDAGVVQFHGQELAAEHRKSALFYVPDAIRPWAELRVEDVARNFAELNGRASKESLERLKECKLEHVLQRRIWMLSKGESKRFTLVLGLLSTQPILMVDEPFDGLDLRQTREVMQLLRTHAASGRTIFVSIHQLNDAAKICDRLLLLAAGRMVGEGTLDELQRQTGLSNGGLEEVFLALT